MVVADYRSDDLKIIISDKKNKKGVTMRDAEEGQKYAVGHT